MISEPKWMTLRSYLERVGIKETDLEEHFVRSSGAGGQNVNKVNTCVYLKHIPTGMEVKCQKTRSQGDNRYFARLILARKIEAQVLGKKSEVERERYKIRKQKQKRSKRAKEKLLVQKKFRAEKKGWRKSPPFPVE